MAETRSQKKIRELESVDDLMDLDEQAVLSEQSQRNNSGRGGFRKKERGVLKVSSVKCE